MRERLHCWTVVLGTVTNASPFVRAAACRTLGVFILHVAFQSVCAFQIK
jgi:hypothetical protein